MVYASPYPVRRRLGAARLALALVALALVLPSQSALAAGDLDTLDKGPAIGDAIPQQVAAIDQNDETRSLTSLIGKNGLIVLFSRSFDWWAPCINQAVVWNSRVEDFRARGYEVATVTYDDLPILKRFAKIKKIQFPVLSDAKSEVIRAFGLVNDNYAAGSYAHGVAWPIILVIAPDGTVSHRFSHRNHHIRPDIDAVLKELGNK